MKVELERVRVLADQLDPLVAESTAHGFVFVQRLVDEWRAGTNRFDRPGELLFAARADRRIVGVCGLNVDPYIADARIGRVRHLYVAGDMRRRGVGTQLIDAIIAHAQRTFDLLRLRTRNPEAACFYERLGFARSTETACTHRLDLRTEEDNR